MKSLYFYVLTFHSNIRWIVLVFILYSIGQSCVGLWKRRTFSGIDNFFRHSTATVAHIQLMLGVILYLNSPVVSAFWRSVGIKPGQIELWFFPLFHIIMMVAAIVILTIGSALAKRKITDTEKFRTMVIWFSISLLFMLIAIPWPFSPLSNRPYLRLF